MTALRWLILAPFKLLGAILVAVGYLLAFLIGIGLLGGGTALTLTGGGAILGVPAMVLGFLVLRELFDQERRAPAEVPAAEPQPGWHGAEPTPAGYAPQPCAAHAHLPPAPAPAYAAPAYAPAVYAPAEAPQPVPARAPSRHFSPRRAAYYWVPGHWTVR